MDTNLLIISSILILGFATVIYLIFRKNSNQDSTLLEWLKSMDKRLDHNSQQMNDRLDNAARVIASVQKNIGEMSEIGRSMQDLQDLLKSPKLRGNVGEQVLKELLGQVLPKSSFYLQYGFKSGSIVDAAIKTEAGIIPIDSKFPMENFRKMNRAETETEKKSYEKDFASDVKRHIDAISGKYILTNEGTIDYALMYIPSEAIYYEMINNSTLLDYAAEKRVLPVSPMTFYAYLRSILIGFEGQRITAQTKEILQGIRSIQKDYEKVSETLDTLGKHITNSYNTMTNVSTGFEKLGIKIRSTSSLKSNEENLLE
ncbi:MAG: DNA recombination protein RmuC [Candidatus Levyibacteriota bacterium]